MFIPISIFAGILACASVVRGGVIGLDGRDPAANELQHKPRPNPSSCLLPRALQTASHFTGQEKDTEGINPGQSKSSTYVLYSLSLSL